ncbi:MAG: hypothetical protein IPP69_14230 [Flavobacteriales bacterium]|nr:hypothetical protein [Flavobacteriales bacterium]
MKFLCLFFSMSAVCFTVGLTAQTPEMTWAFGLGSSSNEDIHSVTVDQNGHIIIVGGFYATIDFDPGPGVNEMTANGDMDLYIAKYDSESNLQWVKQIGSELEDFARYVQCDEQGNIFVTGYFSGSVDFDSGVNSYVLTSNGLQDVFVLKMNGQGDLIWVYSFGGDSTDMGYAVMPDADGNVYVTGAFMNEVDFDSGQGIELRSASERDIYLLKLNQLGNFIWVYAAGGTGWDYGGSIILTESAVYVSGAFRNQVNFNPNSSELVQSAGNVDSFIAKFQSAGQFEWVKTIGGPLEDYVFFNEDPSGYLCAGGWFKGTCDFDPSENQFLLTSNGQADGIICKYDLDANLIWAKNYGGVNPDYGQGVNVDGNGNVYVSGLFEGSPDMDPGNASAIITSNGLQDMFVSKYTMNGDFVWTYGTGSPQNDYAYTTCVSESGEVYVGGWVGGSLDFDQGDDLILYDLVGGHDIALFKLETICPDIGTSQSFNLCPGDSIMVGNSTYTHDGVYEDKFIAINGCDSIVVTILAYTQIIAEIETNGDIK